MAINPGVHAPASSSGTTSLTTPSRNSAATGSTFEISGSSDVAPLTVGDNKGNTYTQAGTPQATASGGLAWKFVCQNGAGGTGHTATVTWTLTDTPVIFFLEITGATTTPLDANTQGTDNASPYTLASGTLAQANEMVTVTIHGNGSTNPATYAESTGFTILESQLDNSSYDAAALAYKIVASTTSVVPSFTCTGSTSAALKLTSYKESAGTAPPYMGARRGTLTVNSGGRR